MKTHFKISAIYFLLILALAMLPKAYAVIATSGQAGNSGICGTSGNYTRVTPGTCVYSTSGTQPIVTVTTACTPIDLTDKYALPASTKYVELASQIETVYITNVSGFYHIDIGFYYNADCTGDIPPSRLVAIGAYVEESVNIANAPAQGLWQQYTVPLFINGHTTIYAKQHVSLLANQLASTLLTGAIYYHD